MKYTKLSDKASDLFKKHETDAGFDLTATRIELDIKNQVMEYGTDIAVAIPENHVGLIFPRSSIYKTSQSLVNSVGVIDSDYRGEILFKFRVNPGEATLPKYKVGDRIGQLVVVPLYTGKVELVNELDDTNRGNGGFGSTGE